MIGARARIAAATVAVAALCVATATPARGFQAPSALGSAPAPVHRVAAFAATGPFLSLEPSYGLLNTPVRVLATQNGVGGSGVSLIYPVGAQPIDMPPGPNNTNIVQFDADTSTCGPQIVTVQWPIIFLTMPQANPTDTPGQDTATFPVLCPAIMLTPDLGYNAGQVTQVTVTYTDFDPPSDDLMKTLSFDGTVVGTFGFSQPIVFSASGGCGPHTVELSQPSSAGVLDATAIYTVQCPAVTIDPNMIARVSQPVPIAVNAQFFPPNAPVTIRLGGQDVGTGTTDATGAVSATVVANGLDCETHNVIVSTDDVAGIPPATARAPLDVSCEAVVKADPDVVEEGMTTHITGAGFTPGSTVTFVWQLPDGSHEPVDGSPQTATASELGAIDFYSLLPRQDETGQRVLLASDGSLSAMTKVLVQDGTMQPSGGLVPGIVTRN